mmetsp:Transcript_1869/g.3168  ORF Transcript_1869/g.3168 Transcript_1869/m.3168 type:complete len:90 (+) Transcript_1869:500-769(+)
MESYLLSKLQKGDFDFTMRIYNSDGSEFEMCGNGIRCFARFLQDLGEDGTILHIELRSLVELMLKVVGSHCAFTNCYTLRSRTTCSLGT